MPAMRLISIPAAAICWLALVADTRPPVIVRNGLIATSQPLASAAGLRVLQEEETPSTRR